MNPVTLDVVLGLLDKLAPVGLAEAWDKVGLMIGSRQDPVSGVTVALDPTLAAVEATLRSGSSLLVTHHPLLFKPLSFIDPTTPTGAVVFRAIREGVSVLAAHTNLDSALGGVNDVLAGLLDLGELRPLEPAPDPEGSGMGRIGLLERPCSLREMAARVKEALGLNLVGVVGDPEGMVRRVALCGGSGGDLAAKARELGADLYITGEVAHHQAREAEFMGLALIEAGHYHTEVPVVPVLARKLKDAMDMAEFPLSVSIFEEERSPYVFI